MGNKIVLEGTISDLTLKSTAQEPQQSSREIAQSPIFALSSPQYYCSFELSGQKVTCVYLDTKPFRNKQKIVVVGEITNEGNFYVEAFWNVTTDFLYDPSAAAISGTGRVVGLCLVMLPFLIWQIARGSSDVVILVIMWSLLVFLSVVSALLAWFYPSARKATQVLKDYLKSRE